MKILYLCPDLGIPVLGPKGAAVHVREMVAALGRAKHNVVLATQLLNKSPWETPAEAPAPLIQVRPSLESTSAVLAVKQFNQSIGAESSTPGELRRILYNRDLETELHRRFAAEPPDLIYERASLYSTAGVALARNLGCPLIVELNAPLAVEQTTYRATGFGELAAEAERWTLKNANAVLVVSSELRQHVLALGVKESRVHVVPNGVNASLFHPGPRDETLRARWNLNGAGPVVGFVGGLRPWHGVEALPDLLERLARTHPGVRLVVAGDGPLRSELENVLSRRALSSRVIFTGLVAHEQVPDIIRQFDMALAPYPQLEHAFYFSPLKLFEYMACGVPVVAAALGQITELLQDGETGMLYPPGDMETLAERCSELLSNGALHARVGKAAAELVLSRFTWDHNAARVAELAATLTACQGKPRE
jgi:glycosyltransferase involved in cell wall biosynthesis